MIGNFIDAGLPVVDEAGLVVLGEVVLVVDE